MRTSPRLAEFLAGCRDESPLLLGVAPFGMIYGIGALALAALPYKLGLAAVLVAWQTRNVLATIGAGMAALHLFKLVF
jgi:hypothetical protein